MISNGEVTEETDFGGISEKEIFRTSSSDAFVDDDTIAVARRRVAATGAVNRLAKWRREDNPSVGAGGRPMLIGDEAILVGLTVLASEHAPLLITNLAELFQYRLSPQARLDLRLPVPAAGLQAGAMESDRWYRNTHNAFHRLIKPIDPYPQPRYLALTYTEIKAILDAHDVEREVVVKARLDELTKSFLTMSFMEQPRRLRRATKRIDISLDQTFIKPPTKKGFSRKGLPQRVREEVGKTLGELKPGPVDAFAGYYVTKADHPDLPKGSVDPTAPGRGGKYDGMSVDWGWMANIAVRVNADDKEAGHCPQLATAFTLSMPNIGVSEEAVELMRATKDLDPGLLPGLVDADKAYFANAVVERLHEPTFNLGFTPSTEYRVDRLGVQGTKAGAELIEGKFYCPAMPKELKSATQDHLKKDSPIDEDTLYLRHKERTYFELRPKEKPDEKGRVPMMCPASGPSATVLCPLKELTKGAPDKERREVDPDQVPEFPEKICTQHSVSFNESDGMRQKQAFAYKSKEWHAFHKHARNSIESLNAGIKDQAHEVVEESSRRRVRGFAAAQLFVTILLTNYNLRKIASFLRKAWVASKKIGSGPIIPPKMRRRDGVWHNPYTGTYPPGARPEPATTPEVVHLTT